MKMSKIDPNSNHLFEFTRFMILSSEEWLAKPRGRAKMGGIAERRRGAQGRWCACWDGVVMTNESIVRPAPWRNNCCFTHFLYTILKRSAALKSRFTIIVTIVVSGIYYQPVWWVGTGSMWATEDWCWVNQQKFLGKQHVWPRHVGIAMHCIPLLSLWTITRVPDNWSNHILSSIVSLISYHHILDTHIKRLCAPNL